MREKIAEIVKDSGMCRCSECNKTVTDRILALIAEEQKPLVKALKEAQLIAEECASMNKRGTYPELIAEELTEKLAELKLQIDAALKGESDV
jgi:hypothetical protein